MSAPRNFCDLCGDTHSRTELDRSKLDELLLDCADYFNHRAKAGSAELRLHYDALVAMDVLDGIVPVPRFDALLATLGDFERYFDSRADCDLTGTPSRFVPNTEMRLLHGVRVAIHSAELVAALEGK